jgi:phosphatidate cytidylyltransferase
MNTKADFSDLMPRIVSAIALVFIGAGIVWVGGDPFGVFLIVAAGLMGWETSGMHQPLVLVNYAFGLVLAALVLALMFLPTFWSGVLVGLVCGAAILGHKSWVTVIIASAAIAVTCVTLNTVRIEFGLGWTIWLLLVVVASDVGGYFAGKLIGGPKILPRISPKKTWSGTLGGWALAALVGFGAVQAGIAGMSVILVSVVVALAAQIGDLLESAMKRRAGVKDSSHLIPGHGGLLDRFDGTVGASCAVGVVLALGGARALGMA